MSVSILTILVTALITVMYFASLFGFLFPIIDRDVELDFFIMMLAIIPVVNTILAIYVSDLKNIKKIL